RSVPAPGRAWTSAFNFSTSARSESTSVFSFAKSSVPDLEHPIAIATHRAAAEGPEIDFRRAATDCPPAGQATMDAGTDPIGPVASRFVNRLGQSCRRRPPGLARWLAGRDGSLPFGRCNAGESLVFNVFDLPGVFFQFQCFKIQIKAHCFLENFAV